MFQEEARHTICKMLDEIDFGTTEQTVRVNSISSGLTAKDLDVTLGCKKLPPTLMLPKVENVEELAQVVILIFINVFFKKYLNEVVIFKTFFLEIYGPLFVAYPSYCHHLP